MTEDKRPEWIDLDYVEKFATRKRWIETTGEKIEVTKGGFFRKNSQFHEPTIEKLVHGVLAGDRSILARSITLIESHAEQHFQKAQELLKQLLPHTGKTIRIGITGVPGAGKSTFIEAFGTYLCNKGLQVAVLTVDPSSRISGGSILGDKTRMEQLSRNPSAFIRPSPSGGKLGGVHRKTRETMLVCEAYGFDVVLIETVGVGQSEVHVREMVDFFLLIVLTGAGDELQGMKKGILELADMIIVNKADGDNKINAHKTKQEYNQILHFLQRATKGWETRAYTCSAIQEHGMKEIWSVIQEFEITTKQSGVFDQRRRLQAKEWMRGLILDQLQMGFFLTPIIKEQLPKVENQVMSGEKTVAHAVEELFQYYLNSLSNK
jgi:LAO/AO transport system kinase